jgi:hypothetical protein
MLAHPPATERTHASPSYSAKPSLPVHQHVSDHPVASLLIQPSHPASQAIQPAKPSAPTSGSQTLHASLNRPSLQSVDKSSSSAITLEERCRAIAWLALQQLQPYCRTAQTQQTINRVNDKAAETLRQLDRASWTANVSRIPSRMGGQVQLLGQLQLQLEHSRTC